MTTNKALADLKVGDVVLAVDGKARPFPYVVTQVIDQPKYGVTRVDYAHGGFIPFAPRGTSVTVAQ